MLFREKIFLSFAVAVAVFVAFDHLTPHVDRYWENATGNHGRYLIGEGNRVGFINGRGSVVIEQKFQDAPYYFKESPVPVKVDGGWIYLDESRGVSIPGIFYWAQPFSHGLAAVAIKHRKAILPQYGFIDIKGNRVIPLDYQQVRSFSENGLAAVRVGLKWGYIDTQNTFLISPKFDEARDYSEQMAAVSIGGQWGYVDQSGIVVVPIQYEQARDFNDGLAAVKLNGAWGFINQLGQWIVEPTYADVLDFSEGKAFVKGMNGFGYIDKDGKIVLRSVQFTEARSFKEGLAAVKTASGLWGYMDHTGKLMISGQFDWASDFKGGLARVAVGKNTIRRGYVNQKGDMIWDPAGWQTAKNLRDLWLMILTGLLLLFVYSVGHFWRIDRKIKGHFKAQEKELEERFKPPTLPQ